MLLLNVGNLVIFGTLGILHPSQNIGLKQLKVFYLVAANLDKAVFLPQIEAVA